MKNRLIYLLLFFSILFLATSCQNEESYIEPEDEKEAVNFVLNIPGLNLPSTYSMDLIKESEIKEVDIIVFKVDAVGNQTYAYHEPAINILHIDNKVKFHAKLKEENDRNIVIIANAHTEVNSIISGLTEDISTKTDVLELLEYSKTGKWEADGASNAPNAYTNIPMIAETGKINIAIGTKITNIWLTRMLARIDFILSDDAVANFKLENIYLCNYSTNGYIAPIWDIKGVLDDTPAITPNLPSTLNRKIGASDAIKYEASGLKSFTGEIYTFEANAADDTAGSDSPARKDATCIVIEGRYGGAGATTYYRIDFMSYDDIAKVKKYMPLLRNYRYVIEIDQVFGKGAGSLLDALKSNSQSLIQIKNLVYDEGKVKDIIYDREHMLGVNQSTFRFYSGQNFDGTQLDAQIILNTNYKEGWIATIIDNKGQINPQWLSLQRYMDVTGTTQVGIIVDTNAPDKVNVHTGYIDFKAGDLTKRVIFYSDDPFIDINPPLYDGQLIDFGYGIQDLNIYFDTNARNTYTVSDMNAFNEIFSSAVPLPNSDMVDGAPGNTVNKNVKLTGKITYGPVAFSEFETTLTFSTTNTGSTGNDDSETLTIKRKIPVVVDYFDVNPPISQEVPSGVNLLDPPVLTVTGTSNSTWECVATYMDNNHNALSGGPYAVPVATTFDTPDTVVITLATNYSNSKRMIKIQIKYVDHMGITQYKDVGVVTQQPGS